MERNEEGTVSKKRRIDSEATGDIPNHEGEASSKAVETQTFKAKVVEDVDAIYKLYFIGLDSFDEFRRAAFGVAICDQTDKLVLGLKETVSDDRMGRKEIEIRALIRGLKESLDLGIRHLVICCNTDQIYKNITTGKSVFSKLTVGERYNAKEKRVLKELMGEVIGLRKKFASSEATFVVYKDVKFADELAREAGVPHQTCSSDGEYDDDYDWATNGCGCDHFGIPDSPPRAPRPEDFYDMDEYFDYCYGL